MALNKQEQFREIFDALKVAAEVMGQALETPEYRAIAYRLMPFYGGTLARMITAIPQTCKEFPTGWQLEYDIRKALGKPGMPGLTPERIDQNEREIVVSGQSPARAKAAADLMKKTLRRKSEQPLADSMGDLSKGLALLAIPADREIKSQGIKTALDLLEEFDKSPIEEIDSF